MSKRQIVSVSQAAVLIHSILPPSPELSKAVIDSVETLSMVDDFMYRDFGPTTGFDMKRIRKAKLKRKRKR